MLNIANEQLNIFDVITSENYNSKLQYYTLDIYINDIKSKGLDETWNNICQFIKNNPDNLPEILSVGNLGELYEIGLSTDDKISKKNSGQYYTPEDVARVMSEWLSQTEGDNICDVGCGTGNLILSYLDFIGIEKAKDLISNGNIYLYDNDKTALNICKTAIGMKYGFDIVSKLNIVLCDFLDKSVTLPQNSKVISNPPYAKIKQISDKWESSSVIKDTMEYYASFMAKIFKQCKSAVTISPFSFISGGKFYSLRQIMSEYCGFVVSFDNVPGNIFNGRKHGIFNSNTSNSVRAAITVLQKNNNKGFQFSPLIRFKQTERKNLLTCSALENFINPTFQIVDKNNSMFFKCHKELNEIFEKWKNLSNGKILSDYIKSDGKYVISMPNTCRYYTTASDKKMNRSGQITLNFEDKKIFNFIYCLINSSFAYWHWRIYDGGITYPKNLLLCMPVFFDLLTEEDYIFFDNITNEMILNAEKFIIKKNNVGTQENIKFPRQYRDKINKRIFKILNINEDEKILDLVHSNMALEVNV
ncbi:N-6 DNA methylase [bacterium]|nr:N-6 DNA methylase [bacterium]